MYRDCIATMDTASEPGVRGTSSFRALPHSIKIINRQTWRMPQYIIAWVQQFTKSDLVVGCPRGLQIRLQFRLVTQFYLHTRQEDSHPSGSCIVRSLALIRHCLGLFLFAPAILSSRFLITITLVSASCFSHAPGILCEIHTSCMESPLPVGYTRWALIFRDEIVVMAEALLPIDRLGRSPK